ncbi:hypothetical protein GCM10023238_17790 [Streptomyces heliomycini]
MRISRREANLAWRRRVSPPSLLWLNRPPRARFVWTVLQALTVAGFALLQHMALKERQLSQV